MTSASSYELFDFSSFVFSEPMDNLFSNAVVEDTESTSLSPDYTQQFMPDFNMELVATPAPENTVNHVPSSHDTLEAPELTPPPSENDNEDEEEATGEASSEEEPPRKKPRVEFTPTSLTPQILLANPDQVVFTRDQLLSISSEQFEQHLQQVQSRRKLTDEERKGVQKQRRLIKNRESAQASRRRKKNYHEVLESRMSELTTVTKSLREDLFSLTSENAALKDEVKFLTKLVKQIQMKNSKR